MSFYTILKKVMQVVLIIIGGIMLIGGGVCATMNVGLAVSNPAPLIVLFALFFGISISVALFGWSTLRYAVKGSLCKSADTEQSRRTVSSTTNSPDTKQGEDR